MNKKVIFIFILTIIALVILALFSFGHLSDKRNAAGINPSSLKPVSTETANKENASVAWNLYRNRDVVENYYSVQLPQKWNVNAGKKAGSYSVNFSDGNGTVVLMDVPDNSTLELFILSQQEPQLKKAIPGYHRVDYKKILVSGNEAYELIYQNTKDNEAYETLKTYIAGSDQAGVLTFTVKQSSFNETYSLLNLIIQNFKWENK
ncbi:MAG: PsbP-related protein [Candidatus Omnitrophica bacterium]|nr:PsbP-related protein [Candidatus Omnitrophota bacterium]